MNDSNDPLDLRPSTPESDAANVPQATAAERPVAFRLPPYTRVEQVVALAAQGMTDPMIARHLGISTNTVGTYWRRVRTTTGLRTRAQIVANAMAAREEPSALPQGDEGADVPEPRDVRSELLIAVESCARYLRVRHTFEIERAEAEAESLGRLAPAESVRRGSQRQGALSGPTWPPLDRRMARLLEALAKRAEADLSSQRSEVP